MSASYSVTFSAVLASSAGTVTGGYFATSNSTGTGFVVATTANLAASKSGVVEGVFLQGGSAGQSVPIQSDGRIPAEICAALVGTGNATDYIECSALGVPTRTTDATNAIGKAGKDGSFSLGLGGVSSAASSVADATSLVKGKTKLTNDFGGTADLPEVVGIRGKVVQDVEPDVGAALVLNTDDEYQPIVNEYHVHAFGAVAGDSSDAVAQANDAAFAAALLKCSELGGSSRLRVGDGYGATYYISKPIQNSYSHITMRGEGPQATIIQLQSTVAGPAYYSKSGAFVPTTVASSLGGRALKFSTDAGSSNFYVSLANFAALRCDQWAQFQVEVDFVAGANTTTPRGIVTSAGRLRESQTRNESFAIDVNTTTGVLTGTMTVGGTKYTLSSAGGTVTAGATVHRACLSYDGSTIRLFLAGAVLATQAATGVVNQKTYEDVLLGNKQYLFPEWCQDALFVGEIHGCKIRDVASRTGAYAPGSVQLAWDSDTQFLLALADDATDIYGQSIKCSVNMASTQRVGWASGRHMGYSNATGSANLEDIQFAASNGCAVEVQGGFLNRWTRVYASGLCGFFIGGDSILGIYKELHAYSVGGGTIAGSTEQLARFGIANAQESHTNSFENFFVGNFSHALVSSQSETRFIRGWIGTGWTRYMITVNGGQLCYLDSVSSSDEDTAATGFYPEAHVLVDRSPLTCINPQFLSTFSAAPFFELDLYNDADRIGQPIVEIIGGNLVGRNTTAGAPTQAAYIVFDSVPTIPVRVSNVARNITGTLMHSAPWTEHATAPLIVEPLDTMGRIEIDLTGLTTYSLTREEWLYRNVEFTGILAADCTVTVPTIDGVERVVANRTAGDFSVSLKTAAGIDEVVLLPGAVYEGERALVACDGEELRRVTRGGPGDLGYSQSKTTSDATETTVDGDPVPIEEETLTDIEYGFAASSGVAGVLDYARYAGLATIIRKLGQAPAIVGSLGPYTSRGSNAGAVPAGWHANGVTDLAIASGALKAKVTGKAGTDIEWKGAIKIVRVMRLQKFSPVTQITSAGTALWVDADDVTSFTLVSGKVSQWNDKSGNGRHLSNADANGRPVPDIRSVNGRVALRAGTGPADTPQQLTRSGDPLGALTAAHIMVVYRNAAAGQDQNTPFTLGTDTGSLIPFFGTIYSDAGSTTRKAFGSPSIDWTLPHLISVISTGSEHTLRIDGVQIGTFATNAVDFPSTIQIGNHGHICEMAIFDAKLSGGDETLMESDYLMAKWGIV